MRPTIRQLEYLVALSEKLNFRAAAEACYVTQPALSAQLQQLEETLGLRLFERDKRQVLPTRAGRELAEAARTVLGGADTLVDLAASLRDPLTGTLRLGVIPTVGPYLLPRVMPAVRERFADLRLYLREDQTKRLVDALKAGDLDVLLLAIDVDLGGVASEVLFSDPFVLAVPPEHRLAAKDEVGEPDLNGEVVLLLEEGHCLREQTLPICTSSGGTESEDFRASSLSTLTQMVCGGLGVTLLPEVAVPQETAACPGLRTVPFGADGPSRQVGLAWRSASARADEFKMLGEVIVAGYLAG